jgi:hypothetical protein
MIGSRYENPKLFGPTALKKIFPLVPPCNKVTMSSETDTPAPNIVTWPSDEEARKAFEEYCVAVGKVCHAWNYFHEKLGLLFARLVPGDAQTAFTTWYSQFRDVVQRDKLRKAVNAVSSWPNSTAKDDVVWLLDRADELAEDRNNAIHAPCCLYIVGRGDGGSVMGPSFFNGNPRAQNLKGKRIIAEFEWCEQYTECLTRFVMQIEPAYAFYDKYPWPQRPEVLPRV